LADIAIYSLAVPAESATVFAEGEK
jgi:hypothetical protein